MSPRAAAPLSLEYALLGFLTERPYHGYDLFKHLEGSEFAAIWQVKQSSLYALLGKLEELGYLEARLLPGAARPERGALRREYALTPAGRAQFEAWLSSPVQHGREMRQAFLAKLYFARQRGETAVAALLAAQRAACQGWLDGLTGQLEACVPEDSYARLVLLYRVSQIRAVLDWLALCQPIGKGRPV